MVQNNDSAFETNPDGSSFDTNPEGSAFETSPDNSAFVTSHSAFVAGRFASPSQSSRSSTSGASVLKSVANIPGAFTLEDDTKKVYLLRDEEKLKDQGAMGCVSSAIWMEGLSEKKVLLKRLYKPVNQNQERLFSNEGFMSKEYGGGGIVKLYGKGETEEFLFMIMEFYEGQTLDKLIAQGTFQGKIQNTCKLVRDILKALGDLHGSEVVHRDLKPANIIIRQNGKPVILDLGLACQPGLSDVAGLKKIGTPKYAAPEQLQGQFSCASDIYSLGKIFLEMFTGEVDVAQVGSIPQPYADFVKKCLNEKAENRYANVEEALEALSLMKSTSTQTDGLDKLDVVEKLKIEVAKKFGDDGVLDKQEEQELRSMAKMWNISEQDLNVFIESAGNEVRKFRETFIVGCVQQKIGFSKQAVMSRANKLYIDPVIVEGWLEEARIAQEQKDLPYQQKSFLETSNEVVVACDGSGDFKKISDALCQSVCKNIIVKSGIYKEHFVIDREVFVKGESGAVVWSNTANENAVVVINAENVVLQNLEIRGAEQEFNKEYSYPACPEKIDACDWMPKCVYIKKNCRLEGLKIAYSAGYGIVFCGYGLNPIIENCIIEKNSQDGILVRNGAAGRIVNTKICGNHYSGMKISSSEAVIEKCEISGNYGIGIVCFLQSSPTINNCDIYGNAYAGVAVKDGSNPGIRNCKIYNGKQGGVFVCSNSKGLIENCDIYGNALSGIEIQNSAPCVKNCKIYNGKQGGVFVYSNSGGVVENCDIYGNSLFGVEIKNESNPRIKNCKIYNGRQQGVYICSFGKGLIEDCDIYGNTFAGVEIEGSVPCIKNCKIHDGKKNGVCIHSKGNGTIENCDIYGNALSGIDVGEESNPSVKNCTIHDGKECGVYVHSKGKGVIEDCNIHNNTHSGVYISGESNPSIKNCNIQDGIDWQKSANVEMKSRDASKKKSKKFSSLVLGFAAVLLFVAVVVAVVVLRTSDKIVGLDYECNYSHNSSFVSSIAAALGNRAAEHNKGVCLMEKKEYGEAYDAFVFAAERGLAEAQSRLGYMYAEGLGVTKDLEKSEHWYWVAANQGNKDAMVSLGNIYYNGVENYGIRKDFYKAFHYYSDAAYAGDADAQFRLAFMYINGEGVEQDYKKAFEWLEKAAMQGYAPAQSEIGGAYERGGGGVEQDYNKAVEWYKKAAMQGYARAQNQLGIAYELGQGVEQDYNKAIEWYQKAAAQGLQVAQENLERFNETPSADSVVELRDDSLVDSRDGQKYKTVIIGHQVWMAENLNYPTKNSYCYGNSSHYCDLYGRLYTWEDAVKACPADWHLPNNAEWETLYTEMGGQSVAGRILKSLTGWQNNGSDDVLFSALPAGRRYSGGRFDKKGEEAFFWSSSQYNYDEAYLVNLTNAASLYHNSYSKISANSVRCVKD